jgi:hypothetical protein
MMCLDAKGKRKVDNIMNNLSKEDFICPVSEEEQKMYFFIGKIMEKYNLLPFCGNSFRSNITYAVLKNVGWEITETSRKLDLIMDTLVENLCYSEDCIEEPDLCKPTLVLDALSKMLNESEEPSALVRTTSPEDFLVKIKVYLSEQSVVDVSKIDELLDMVKVKARVVYPDIDTSFATQIEHGMKPNDAWGLLMMKAATLASLTTTLSEASV